MGHFQDFVERIKRDLAIDTLLPGEARGKRSIRCPLPGHDDHAPSFTIYRETNSWICWSHPGGRNAGSVLDYIMAERCVDFKEAVRIAADLLGLELRRPTEEEQAGIEARRQREDVLTALAQVAHGWLKGETTTAAGARDYLHGRGFSDDLMREQRLGLLDIQKLFQVRARHPLLAEFSEADLAAAGLRSERGSALFLGPRLAIPLLSRQRVTGMTFRALDPDDKRKYMHLPGPAGLYNEDALAHRSREVVLTEGVPDCWTLLEWGIPAVGNLGVEASKHAARFQRLGRVTLVWDNDAAGQGRVLKSARAIQEAMLDGEVRILHVPGAKDVNDWARAGGTKEEFQRLLTGAPDLIEYQIERLPDVKGGGRLGHEDQQALRGILETLATLPEIRQSGYLASLKARAGLPMGSLRSSLKEIKSTRERRDRETARTQAQDAPDEPEFIFETIEPYIAALDFRFKKGEAPRANLGVHLPALVDGAKVLTKQIIEVVATPEGLKVARVPYAARQVGDPKLTCFPDEDFPHWSLEPDISHSVKQFLTNPAACTPNTAELFEDIRAILKEFIWFPAETDFDVVTAYIMLCYVFPVFSTIGYLHFNGNSGSGKSLSMDFIERLGFNARKTGSVSNSALYRQVHASRTSLLLDEAEKLSRPAKDSQDEAARLIMNDAYKVNGVAQRTNPDTLQTESFRTYGPKCLGSIKELDPTFGSRCIIIHSLKKLKTHLLRDYAQNRVELDERAAILRNRLHCWALTHFHLLHKIYTEDLMGALPDLVSRQREIWLPLITIAHQVDRESIRDETCSLVAALLRAQETKEKEQEKKARLENSHILVLTALKDILTGEDRRTFELLMQPHEYNAPKLAETILKDLIENGTWPHSMTFGTAHMRAILTTNHVAAEGDFHPRRFEGGKRISSVRLTEPAIENALRRLQGLDAEEDAGEGAPPDASAPGATPGPLWVDQATIIDNEPLPF